MIADIIEFEFMQNAFISGLFIGLICPIIGVFLAVRRLSIIADALSHVTLAGVAAGLFLKARFSLFQFVNPVYVGMLFSLIGAFFVEQLRKVYQHYQELALPIILSIGTGLGVVLISLADGFNADLFGLLFGSLIAVSRLDVWVIVGVALLVIGTVLLLYKEMFYLAFEEEAAVIAGIPKGPTYFLFIFLVALVIAVSMNIVGVLLVASLISLPVAAGLQVAKSFKQVFVYSIIFAQSAVLLGIILSYYIDVATGGTVVITSALILVIVIYTKKLQQRKRMRLT